MVKNIQQGASGIKVLRLDMCISIISLSNIMHQIWRNNPFSQGNKEAKRAARLEVASDTEEVGSGVERI